MFRHLICYLTRDFSRSYRYIPSLFTFLICLCLFYTYAPNPIMGSYAATSVLLLLISSWLAYSFFASQERVQEQITILRLGSAKKYYAGVLCSVFLLTALLALCSILYPIVFDKFDVPATWEHVTVGFVAHLSLAILGIAIAALFNSRLVSKMSYAIGGILALLAISFSQGKLVDILPPGIQWITWVLPPAFPTMDMLMNYEEYSVLGRIGVLVLPFPYSAGLLAICWQWMKRKDL